MQKDQKLQHQQEIEQYLCKKQVYPLFERLLSLIIKDQPANPMAYMIENLQKSNPKYIFIIGNDIQDVCIQTAQKLNFKHIEIQQNNLEALNDENAFQNFEKLFDKNENLVIQNFPLNINQAQALQKLKIIPDLLIFVEDNHEDIKEKLQRKYQNQDKKIENFLALQTLNLNQVKKIHQNSYYQVEKEQVIQEIWRILQYSNKLNQEKPLRICMFDPSNENLGLKTAEKYGLVHVSVRSLLNEQVIKNTHIGKKIQNSQLQDEMISDLVLLRLQKKDCQMQGFLLEGYPKNQNQISFLIKNNLQPKFFVEIFDKEPNDFIKTVELAFQNMVFKIQQTNKNDMLEKITFQIENYKY